MPHSIFIPSHLLITLSEAVPGVTVKDSMEQPTLLKSTPYALPHALLYPSLLTSPRLAGVMETRLLHLLGSLVGVDPVTELMISPQSYQFTLKM